MHDAELTARWRSRIVRYGAERPDQLLANPRGGFKVHPRAQQEAMTGALDEIGWLAPAIVNERTGHLIDGHMRVSLAISAGEPLVPTAYVDLSPEEEVAALATFDPIGAIAATDDAELAELLAEVEVGEGALKEFLDDLAARHPAGEGAGGLGLDDLRDAVADEAEPTTYRCPKCGHSWSGSPT